MSKDHIFIGSIAGMVGTLFKDLPNLILYKLKIVHFVYAQLAASAHLVPDSIGTFISYIIGISADTITGGTIGVVIILFLDYFGLNLWWFKGCIIGSAIWLFGLGVILNLGSVRLVPADPVFRLTALFDHWIFGLVTVFIIKKWITSTVNNKS